MKIQQKQLLAGINAVISSVKQNNSDILANVKIESKDNILSLSATDGDTWTKYKLSCDGDDFSTTINAASFQKLISKIDGEIEIDLKDLFQIKKGRSIYKLPTLPASDFPEFREIGDCVSFKSSISKIIDKVKFAASNDPARYYLGGACLHGTEGVINAVATDGHRLALANVKSETPEFKIIIPKKSLADISRISGIQNISISKNLLRISSESLEYTTKLVDGGFPDYNRVIPENHPILINLNKKELAESLDRMMSVLNDKHNSAKFKFGDKLVIESKDGLEEIDIQNESNVEIGFNVKFLLEILKHMDEPSFTIHLKDDKSPALITSGNLTFVLMPIRI
jgi:DNA polymerase-3 subunit beta